jgi:hypothetical protein
VHRILITGLRLDLEVKEICTNWCGEDFRVTSLTSKHRLRMMLQKIRYSIFLFRHAVTNETRWASSDVDDARRYREWRLIIL